MYGWSNWISWNANISVLGEDTCWKFGTNMQIMQQHDDAEIPTWQKRNRKLIRMTPSVKRLEQIWVVLSDYTISARVCRLPIQIQIQIWTKFGTEFTKHATVVAERAEFVTYHENPRCRQPPYWISKNVNISGLDEDISTNFDGQMHHAI